MLETKRTFLFRFLALFVGSMWFGVDVSAQLIVPPCEKTPIFLPSIPECEEGSYRLKFADEFDGDTLDTTIWEIQPWRQGALDDSQNKEYLSLNNVNINSGICTIEVRKEQVTARAVSWEPADKIMEDGRPNLRTYDYTGSAIWTIPQFRYGKYEARCRQPDGISFWPAFWMYGGPIGNEIDVFDSYGKPGDFIAGVGYGFDGNIATQGCHKRFNDVADFTQWHVFSCTFQFDHITWEIDGQPIRTFYRYTTVEGQVIKCGDEIGHGTILQQNAFPHDSMSIILSMGLQSGDRGPNESTEFPAQFEIDYVRFYELVEGTNDTKLNVYPNPAVDQITIDAQAQMDKVVCYSITGQEVWFAETLPQGQHAVSVAEWPTGLYFIRAVTDGKLKVSKIVKY